MQSNTIAVVALGACLFAGAGAGAYLFSNAAAPKTAREICVLTPPADSSRASSAVEFRFDVVHHFAGVSKTDGKITPKGAKQFDALVCNLTPTTPKPANVDYLYAYAGEMKDPVAGSVGPASCELVANLRYIEMKPGPATTCVWERIVEGSAAVPAKP